MAPWYAHICLHIMALGHHINIFEKKKWTNKREFNVIRVKSYLLGKFTRVNFNESDFGASFKTDDNVVDHFFGIHRCTFFPSKNLSKLKPLIARCRWYSFNLNGAWCLRQVQARQNAFGGSDQNRHSNWTFFHWLNYCFSTFFLFESN